MYAVEAEDAGFVVLDERKCSARDDSALLVVLNDLRMENGPDHTHPPLMVVFTAAIAYLEHSMSAETNGDAYNGSFGSPGLRQILQARWQKLQLACELRGMRTWKHVR